MILLKILNEKMKKVLFFMFLLFLCLEAASVKAQVRIGGNTAPQGAAVLDLNADNTATPTANKGALALPRINLGALSGSGANLNGATPITGMLVYNTNTALGVGIYSWSGNKSKWMRVDVVPPPTPSDSGMLLMSAGDTIRWVTTNQNTAVWDTVGLLPVQPLVTWTKIVDTTVTGHLVLNQGLNALVLGLVETDLCTATSGFAPYFARETRIVYIRFVSAAYTPRDAVVRLRCFRPSA